MPTEAPAIPASETVGLSIRELDRQRRLDQQNLAADSLARWRNRHRYYYREIARLFRMHISPGSRILHVGCSLGDLLASLEPSVGVGIDLSPKMIEQARSRHPEPNLSFHVQDPEDFTISTTHLPAAPLSPPPSQGRGRGVGVPIPSQQQWGNTWGGFDYVIIDTALADMGDIQSCLEAVAKVCKPETRVCLSYYNDLWGPLLRLATKLGLRRNAGEQNWLAVHDVENLLKLAGMEVIAHQHETLLPINIPLVVGFLNRFVAKFWPFRNLCLTQFFVARRVMPPADAEKLSVTVVIPTRNERGNIADAVRRCPDLGSNTEIIFIDGNSTDGTPEEIQRVISENPHRDIRYLPQGDGKGKGDAVRKAFAAAKNDILMILDADLTVPPEDLPRFVQQIVEGRGEFINGTRLVYPMEKQAMRFLNKIGNRFFSSLFTWLLGQRFRDTLCGTKVLTRANYKIIADNRSYFGDFDPFGDFDLIFGAARANFKIIEVPVRYRARTYGTTNISRFRHGFLLLRMSWVAFRRLKMR